MTAFAHKLYLDTEVKAPQPKALDNWGLDVYARHPATRLLLFPWAIDNSPINLWDIYHDPKNPPRLLVEALRDDSVQLVAHNAQFDRVVLMHRLGLNVPMHRWYCTRARAAAHGLPGSLGLLSKIFALGDEGKQEERGGELIDLFCERGADPDAHPVEWLEFCDYAIHDISAMRALEQGAMPGWCYTPFEQRYYALNQKINDRGFMVDLPLATKMIQASERAQASLNARVEALTNGTILKGTQREKIKDWLNVDGMQFLNMQAETLRKALRDHGTGLITLTDQQREMIELRLLSAKSSIAKCHTALETAGPGSRIRYTITYGGGGRNLRNSHKGFQPGNMPRPSQARKSPEMQLAVVEALQQGYASDIWGDETMAACADGIRGLIIAAPGHSLYTVDWSNIEGRKIAWFAGEEWKLQMYRDQDAGIGADGYKILGNRMTGKPIEEIDDFERQGFKGCDLSMGYEGGVGAYTRVANSYQIDLIALGKLAPTMLPHEYLVRGEKEWNWTLANDDTDDADDNDDKQTAKGLPKEIFIACSAMKHSWRDTHPKITQLWKDLLNCAKTAAGNPGKVFECAHGKVKMACDTNMDWLAVAIPSGRQIMFAKPRIKTKVTRDKHGNERVREELTALKAPGWYRQSIYGGYIANAITQGGCRDILAHGELDLDALGFPIVMDIHDDIIAEVPDGSPLTIEQMVASMVKERPWHVGLPLAAKGHITKRLYKT